MTAEDEYRAFVNHLASIDIDDVRLRELIAEARRIRDQAWVTDVERIVHEHGAEI